VFRWEEFLDLAEELAGRAGDEAALRTALSRAYYAVFHVGREYLAHAAITIDRSGSAHRQVQSEIEARDYRTGQDIFRLHRLRKEADYDDEFRSDVEEQAVLAVALARSIIERIRVLS
jgi:uncharacterized protein (UPF0332 family)